MKRSICVLLAIGTFCFAISGASASTRTIDDYDAYYVDLDGDGLSDILLASPLKYLVIAMDITIIVPLKDYPSQEKKGSVSIFH